MAWFGLFTSSFFHPVENEGIEHDASSLQKWPWCTRKGDIALHIQTLSSSRKEEDSSSEKEYSIEMGNEGRNVRMSRSYGQLSLFLKLY